MGEDLPEHDTFTTLGEAAMAAVLKGRDIVIVTKPRPRQIDIEDCIADAVAREAAE